MTNRLLRQIEDTLGVLKQLVKSLEDAKNHADPFGAFVFRERKEYRIEDAADRSKSYKRTKEWMYLSYQRAQAAGFRGDYENWCHLLRAWTPTPAPAPPSQHP